MKIYVLGRAGSPPAHATPPYATLTPDNWDDFGFVTLFNLKLVSAAGRTTELGSVKISGESQPKRTKLDPVFDELPGDHFSLGQSLSYYTEIRSLGKSTRETLLSALRDVVYLPELYERYRNLEVFSSSLMRYSES